MGHPTPRRRSDVDPRSQDFLPDCPRVVRCGTVPTCQRTYLHWQHVATSSETGLSRNESTSDLLILSSHQLFQMWLESVPQRNQVVGHPLARGFQFGLRRRQTDHLVACQRDFELSFLPQDRSVHLSRGFLSVLEQGTISLFASETAEVQEHRGLALANPRAPDGAGVSGLEGPPLAPPSPLPNRLHTAPTKPRHQRPVELRVQRIGVNWPRSYGFGSRWWRRDRQLDVQFLRERFGIRPESVHIARRLRRRDALPMPSPRRRTGPWGLPCSLPCEGVT